MYSEDLRMSPRFILLLAAPFAFTLIVLAVVLLVIPIPTAGQIPVYGAMALVAVIAALLLISLSRIRITIDGQTLTIAFRILFAKRIALARIVSCIPTDARVWGMRYRRSSSWRYRGHAGPRRAVMLILTNGAQVLFTSRHPDAVCAALHAHRPAIAGA
jgi:hypothetical protein